MKTASELVRSIVDAGTFGAGVQLLVRHRGRTVVEESIGAAQPRAVMTTDSVQGVYCLTKPIVSCAVCATADAHGIALDGDMRDVSPRLAKMLGDHRVSLRDVLSHRSGLHGVSAIEAMFMPPAQRLHIAEHASIAKGWRVGVDRAYSDFQGWNVLRVWLEEVTGVPFPDAMRAVMLSPLELDDCYFGVTDAQWSAVRNRLGTNYFVDQGVPLPMLHGLLRKFIDDPLMQAIGGHASATAIAHFYEGALDVLAGRPRAGLPGVTRLREMLEPTGRPQTDPICNTPVAFGLGFMVDLAEAFGPSIGGAAFGHLGLMGNAFSFADPDLELVAVFASNALLFTPEQRSEVGDLRRSIVDAIYHDVAVAA